MAGFGGMELEGGDSGTEGPFELTVGLGAGRCKCRMGIHTRQVEDIVHLGRIWTSREGKSGGAH